LILFYCFKLFEIILFLFPRKYRKAFFIAIANLAYRFDKKRKFYIKENLKIAFGNTLSEERIRKIGQNCFQNLSLAILQILENTNYKSIEEVGRDVEIKGLEYLTKAVDEKRPVVMVGAHYGNWEVQIAVVSSTIVPITLVRNAGENKYIDRYITDAKRRYRTISFKKKGVVKHLAKALKDNGVIALLIDQNLTTKDGIVVNFFGKTATQTPAPAFLARKYNAIILPSMIHLQKDGRQIIELYEPIMVDKTDDAEADVLKATQAQATWLEGELRKKPDYWFWCHRRWQRMHPEIYKVPK